MSARTLTLITVLTALFLGCREKKDPVYPKPVLAPVSEEEKHVVEDANGVIPGLYYLPILEGKKLACEKQNARPIKNSDRQIIAYLCEDEHKICVKQGTCLLSEANGLRMINFNSRRAAAPVYSEKTKRECPYGLGYKDVCLDPYHTISANFRFHRLGEVIYIPSVRGLKLPNGETHEGYFIVRDSAAHLGTAQEMDFFTGFDNEIEATNVFRKLGLGDNKNRFIYQKAPDDIASLVRRKRSYPKITRKQRDEAGEFLKQYRVSK